LTFVAWLLARYAFPIFHFLALCCLPLPSLPPSLPPYPSTLRTHTHTATYKLSFSVSFPPNHPLTIHHQYFLPALSYLFLPPNNPLPFLFVSSSHSSSPPPAPAPAPPSLSPSPPPRVVPPSSRTPQEVSSRAFCTAAKDCLHWMDGMWRRRKKGEKDGGSERGVGWG
jgi:hypothetical protein